MELSQALPVLRSLAAGVDPVTGAVFPEDSPFCTNASVRALFVAVSALERELDYRKRMQNLPANFGQPWSEEEDKLLATRFRDGATMQEMAQAHRRTLGSCRMRLEKLGLIAAAGNA